MVDRVAKTIYTKFCVATHSFGKTVEMDSETLRNLGHGALGDLVMLSHHSPALHALVGVLKLTPAEVGRGIGADRSRMWHYLNGIDRIPDERRKALADMLAVVLEGYEESLNFAKSEAKEGRLKEAITEPYTEASIPVAEAILKNCHRLLELERKNLAEALKKISKESAA